MEMTVKAAVPCPETQDAGQSGPVEVVRHREPTPDQLEALWHSLPGRPHHSPFQSTGFIQAFRTHIASAEEMRFSVLAASFGKSQAPDMLLPVVTFRRGPFRVASMPDMGLADQNAPVLSHRLTADPQAARVLCKALLQSLRGADLVDVAKISPLIGTVENPLSPMQETVETQGTLVFDGEALAEAGSTSSKSVYKEAPDKISQASEGGRRSC